MTSPFHDDEFRIDGLPITSTTTVLQRRRLHDATAMLSRFADPVWDLFPALPDRHRANQAIHWDTYPQPLLFACKLYVFALVNVTEHAPRVAGSRADVLSIPSIWADLSHLRVFLRWLADRGITSLADATEIDLDRYYSHVREQPDSTPRQRKLLLAVQRLHLYRDYLPAFARMPIVVLWGGASAAELAGDPDPRRLGNRTPRIHPDVMGKLLSAALLVTETIAADVLPAARQMITMRALAVSVAADPRPYSHWNTTRWNAAEEQLARVLHAFAAAGHPLPGRRDGRRTVVDLAGLVHAGQLPHVAQLKLDPCAAAITNSGLPVVRDLLRVTKFTKVGDRAWHDGPVETSELRPLIRHITTACFIVIAYLSGMRVGEVLNLRRGCVTRDPKLDLIFLSGHQLKTTPQRAERSPATIPWVINAQGAQAIAILEDLAPSATLFPFGHFGTANWLRSPRTRTKNSLADDVHAFITWFNTTIADTVDHPTIGEDEHGPITGVRLRRTLAWHIVRRPGGTIAGANQYGHLFTRMTHGYAGQADAGFLDEITFEQFLLRTEQLHDDHQRLTRREHVSGPAADTYRHRVREGQRFNGVTLTSAAQANTALSNPDLQIHHGALLTCVWRPETAACQAPTNDENGPVWARCRLNCSNIAYTERDITELRNHVTKLRTDLDLQVLPLPLHRRLHERLTEHDRAIHAHESTRP
ncbi:integrase [Rhodococcus sp. IEGM 248]|jgi:integrase|nr:integrase [Rhodococcus sp. IEGM 248]